MTQLIKTSNLVLLIYQMYPHAYTNPKHEWIYILWKILTDFEKTYNVVQKIASIQNIQSYDSLTSKYMHRFLSHIWYVIYHMNCMLTLKVKNNLCQTDSIQKIELKFK